MSRNAFCILCISSTLALGAASSASSASSAGLGTPCCSDLAERLSELEAVTTRKSTRKLSVTIYGEANQAVMFWDDGPDSDFYVASNGTNRNLFGIRGAGRIAPDWSVGYKIELEVLSGDSDFVDQGGADFITAINPIRSSHREGSGDDGLSGVALRHANWWIESEAVGRLTVGQTSNATDGITEIDLSDTGSASTSGVTSWNGSFFVRDHVSGLSPSFFAGDAPNLNGFIDPALYVQIFRGNLDGVRGNFVRYNSPVIAGFTFSAAWGEDDDIDAALRYANESTHFKFAAGIGFSKSNTTDTDQFTPFVGAEIMAGSASIKHKPTGFFATVAAGRRDWTDSRTNLDNFLLDEWYYYGKGGVSKDWLTLGTTALYGEYYKIQDVGADFSSLGVSRETNTALNEEAEVWGLGVVQHIDNSQMEVYVAYRHYRADNITDSFFAVTTDTVVDVDLRKDVIMSGARIEF